MDCDTLQSKKLLQFQQTQQQSYDPAVVLDQMSMKTNNYFYPQYISIYKNNLLTNPI
ncbi:unnamed protein product [Paramecium sonneborni]|uniref:Uncharacterized protein n=1 Tax=Paramecium sonneborni TaxID=65129 RepID=A0A8S1KME7_9CILI|nr:unnamed protein product [Paramecium sonneborni]